MRRKVRLAITLVAGTVGLALVIPAFASAGWANDTLSATAAVTPEPMHDNTTGDKWHDDKDDKKDDDKWHDDKDDKKDDDKRHDDKRDDDKKTKTVTVTKKPTKTVTTTTRTALPVTGSSNTSVMVPLALGSVLVLFGAAMLVLIRRWRREEAR